MGSSFHGRKKEKAREYEPTLILVLDYFITSMTAGTTTEYEINNRITTMYEKDPPTKYSLGCKDSFRPLS